MTAPISEHGITSPGGDPDELRDVARFLRAAAESFTQVAGNVRRAGSTVGNAWSGPAAALFKLRVRMTAHAAEAAPDACGRAADALERLASALERAQRRALAAQDAASAATGSLAMIARERDAISGTPAAADPTVQRRLSELECGAESDLASARREGADAYADAQAAAAEAAAALNAATEAFGLPPQPENAAEVPPNESTGHWLWRQFYDVVFDPLFFWRQPDLYRQVRAGVDIPVAGADSAIWAMNKYRMDLFQHEILRAIPGPLVPRTMRGIDLATGLPIWNTTWIQQVNYSAVRAPDLAATSRVASIAKKAGPVGVVIDFGTAALDQYMADKDRADLSTEEKAARTIGSAAIVGATSWAGGLAGAKAGAAVGAAIGSFFPGPGTAVGGVVGAIAGGIIGSGAGQAIGSKIREWFFG